MSHSGRPENRVLLTPHDAELTARDWLAYLGFTDARVTVIGPDEGIDVISRDVVAQVKAVGQPVARPVVQQIYGVASLEGKQALLFTINGVTRQAREWADRAGVGLFRLDLAGGVTAENGPAEDILAATDRWAVGWEAVRSELEVLLAEGRPASISSLVELSNGGLGYWEVGHDGISRVQVTRDLAGSRVGVAPSVADAVRDLAAGVRALGGSFQDCRPYLTVEGVRRRFFPRLSYQPAEPDAPISDAPQPPSSTSVARSISATDDRLEDPVAEPRPTRSDRAIVRITASDLYQALAGQRCDRRIYLDERGVPGSPPSTFSSMMFDLGAEHEADYFASFPDARELTDGSIEERAALTRVALDEGVEVLYQPAFRVERTMAGYRCEFVGLPDFILTTAKGHVIRDTKVALHIEPAERPDIDAQLQFYGWLYEQEKGHPPAGLEALNGAGEVHEYEYGGWGAIEDVVDRIIRLKTSKLEPSCRARSAHKSCPYFNLCWSEAQERGDLSTIPGMMAGLIDELAAQGVETIDQLLDGFDETVLADIEITSGGRSMRVGRRSAQIMRSAVALHTGVPIWFANADLPRQEHLVMFDLEGVPKLAGADGLIYLWGCEVVGPSPMPYVPVFAGLGEGGAADGWYRFLEHANQLLDRYGSDLPFVHWANYERTQIRQHIAQYGDIDGIAARVLDNLVDLYDVVKRSVTLPIHSYSLKAVEKYVGFERSQSEFGGDWSIAIWEQATTAESAVERERLLDQLAVYNQEDCAATGAVLEWLRAEADG